MHQDTTMHNLDKRQISAELLCEGLKAACERMSRELVEGVQHGFFEMVVTVEMTQSKKKCITIKAGKSYRFVV
jgi:hypothetical protein